MKSFEKGEFVGERALFASRDIMISNSVFKDGESPLKESKNIVLRDVTFDWKYPLWYCRGIDGEGLLLTENARSGIWYTHGLEFSDSVINAPKTFRRSGDIVLCRVRMENAQETMWSCENIRLRDVYVKGDYFGLSSKNIDAEDLTVEGNYLFDGGENITVKNSRLISKDAFWNCKNVTVTDSVIVGEYLGWNSENVTLINCEIESNQGMCYMKNVTLRGCRTRATDLAFEYCTVDAEIDSHIDSIKNPISGRIKARSIGEVILDEKFVDVAKTEIITDKETADV